MDALRNVGDAERRTGLEYVVENEMDNGGENQVCCEFNVVFRLHYPDTNQNYMRTHPPTVFCFLFSFTLFCLSAFCLSFCLQFCPLFLLPFVYSYSVFISLISDAHIISVLLKVFTNWETIGDRNRHNWYAVWTFPIFLGTLAKLRNWLLASFCLSVCPHGTTRLPLDGFVWNLIFQDFSKLCGQI